MILMSILPDTVISTNLYFLLLGELLIKLQGPVQPDVLLLGPLRPGLQPRHLEELKATSPLIQHIKKITWKISIPTNFVYTLKKYIISWWKEERKWIRKYFLSRKRVLIYWDISELPSIIFTMYHDCGSN